MEVAPCREVGPELFDSQGPDSSQVTLTEAKRFCKKHCPFMDECLEYAMRAERGLARVHRFGVFGGQSPQARYRLAKARGENMYELALKGNSRYLDGLAAREGAAA